MLSCDVRESLMASSEDQEEDAGGVSPELDEDEVDEEDEEDAALDTFNEDEDEDIHRDHDLPDFYPDTEDE